MQLDFAVKKKIEYLKLGLNFIVKEIQYVKLGYNFSAVLPSFTCLDCTFSAIVRFNIAIGWQNKDIQGCHELRDIRITTLVLAFVFRNWLFIQLFMQLFIQALYFLWLFIQVAFLLLAALSLNFKHYFMFKVCLSLVNVTKQKNSLLMHLVLGLKY